MDIPAVINKPLLYHYTRPDAIESVLTTKSLWARPTWDFEDTHEYIHGLRLIEAHLKQICAARREKRVLVPETLRVLQSYNLNLRRLFERTIAHIEHEIANHSKPKVEIYVACTSANSHSEEMAKRYGSCMIRFNWMLPIVGYACPKQFTAAMLSRVSYNQHEFTQHILAQAFLFTAPEVRTELREFLDRMEHRRREESIAASLASNLCVFAPNIKRPEYAYEQEWRLKTIRINHSVPTLFSRGEPLELRRALQMSEEAEFTAPPKPEGRYVQDLRLEGRMVVDNISTYAEPPIEPGPAIELMRRIYEASRSGFWGTAYDQRDRLLRLYYESRRVAGAGPAKNPNKKGPSR